MTAVPSLQLNTGASIPQVGYGVFKIPPGETAEAVSRAIRAGYRSIDTASAYGNEQGVGEAIAAAEVPRDALFVTTKLWNGDQGTDRTERAFEASLARLGLDEVDLYLIHWPAPGRDAYVETWRTLERIHASGRARAIGVSNFHVEHLTRLLEETSIVPAVNQVELHPRLQQAELRAFHAEHGILTEAWSPLARAKLLDDPTIGEIAAAHGRTPAQVVLRWHVQLGNVAIPKSADPARTASNIALFDFELGPQDMERIAALDSREGRIGPDPDGFDG